MIRRITGSYARFAAAIATMGLVQAATAQSNSAHSIEITADDSCQSALTAAFAATDKEEFARHGDRLHLAAQGNYAKLTEQLLWFAARHQDDSRIKSFVGHVLARLDTSKET